MNTETTLGLSVFLQDNRLAVAILGMGPVERESAERAGRNAAGELAELPLCDLSRITALDAQMEKFPRCIGECHKRRKDAEKDMVSVERRETTNPDMNIMRKCTRFVGILSLS